MLSAPESLLTLSPLLLKGREYNPYSSSTSFLPTYCLTAQSGSFVMHLKVSHVVPKQRIVYIRNIRCLHATMLQVVASSGLLLSCQEVSFRLSMRSIFEASAWLPVYRSFVTSCSQHAAAAWLQRHCFAEVIIHVLIIVRETCTFHSLNVGDVHSFCVSRFARLPQLPRALFCILLASSFYCHCCATAAPFVLSIFFVSSSSAGRMRPDSW